MAQVGFYCPDRAKVLFKDCLYSCRMGERCVSRPTLIKLSKQRVWTGIPSTTQSICGTREAMLKIIKPYFEHINNLAFALLGHKVHFGLEESADDSNAEIAFKDNIQTGIIDYYDPDERILWDYKTSGSFKVRKALGMVQIKVPDPSGAVYKKSGKGFKKGDPKMITMWERDENEVDMWEWILQTNRYAWWLIDAGKPVDKIKIEVISRDGGLKATLANGIESNITIIDVPLLSRDYVIDYFKRKAAMLRSAIALSWAPVCNDKECWNGKKCEGYCPVAHECNKLSYDHPSKIKFQKEKPEILC